MNNPNNDSSSFDWKNNSIDWKDILKKEARGYDKGDDLGEVQELGHNFVVTLKGRISKHKFYLPKHLVKGYDGETLWFNITQQDAEDNFKKDNPPKEGEYSRYESASVTQQPSDSNSSSISPGDNIGRSSTGNINLNERLPLIERGSQVSGSNKKFNKSKTAVEDWDSIIHKGARTGEGLAIGSVTAVNADFIIITSEGAREEYSIPKGEVDSYNGSEVILNISNDRLSQFKVKVPR
ncbi:hypothetical protein [Candidatus Nitrosocosmicus sp. T]